MITKEDFFKKYGDTNMKFSHYYKYQFTYIGNAGWGLEVMVCVGGIADDIYRFEVSADEEVKLSSLDSASWGRASGGGVMVDEFSDA